MANGYICNAATYTVLLEGDIEGCSLCVSNACFSAQCVSDGSHAQGVSCFTSQACCTVFLSVFYSLRNTHILAWPNLLTYFMHLHTHPKHIPSTMIYVIGGDSD